MTTYRTSEIAGRAGVHPNTVRFYEDMGFITKPARLPNGYRVFTELHLRQMELARLALRAEVLQNGLRDKAIEVIRYSAELDFEGAIRSAREYDALLARETENARAAVASVEAIWRGSHETGGASLKRREAAQRLHLTVDTLRNWEMNGLIRIKRRQNGYRVYDAADLERLNIIRTLRCANYSLSAILRLLTRLERNGRAPLEEVLNTPSENEDIVSVCDRLIVSLENTRNDAAKMISLLENMQTE
jgi:DNA-binding transcriptional MerR regulator